MLISLKNQGRLKRRINRFDENPNLILNDAEYSGHASHLKKVSSIILRAR